MIKETIDSFKGNYLYLSNFAVAYFFDKKGREWKSTEHYYQAMKSTDWNDQKNIRLAATPYKSKQLGKKVKLRPDWEEVKEAVMMDALLYKFSQNEVLRIRLLRTGNAMLVEGNTWGDRYWGVCDGKGKNRLGICLMKVREMFKDGTVMERYEGKRRYL
jgi:N-glycosidase YbiA